MNEERFESLLIDELYGELDEASSAAVKRYAAAHPRSASALASLEAVRRAASTLETPPPDGLEQRILTAARQAQTVLPFRRRLSFAVSRAGAWAMRPQTAMAAVFLLMVGSSLLLVRGRSANDPAAQGVKVTEQGAPAAVAGVPGEERETLDSKSAALAHGTQEMPKVAAAAPAATAPSGGAPAGPGMGREGAASGGRKAELRQPSPVDSLASSPAEATSELVASAKDNEPKGTGRGWASPPPGMPPPASKAPSFAQAPPPLPSRAESSLDVQESATGGSAATAPARARAGASSEFERGMAAYRGRQFADAARTFDGLAANGDLTAALWAARSVREASGCSAAVARFAPLTRGGLSTVVAQDATYEAGLCYKTLGARESARAHFTSLLAVPAYAARAQAALDAVGPAPNAAAKPATVAPAKGDTSKPKASD